MLIARSAPSTISEGSSGRRVHVHGCRDSGRAEVMLATTVARMLEEAAAAAAPPASVEDVAVSVRDTAQAAVSLALFWLTSSECCAAVRLLLLLPARCRPGCCCCCVAERLA